LSPLAGSRMGQAYGGGKESGGNGVQAAKLQKGFKNAGRTAVNII